MESSTKILRRMLDERGVEWWNQTDTEPQTATMAMLGDQLIEYHENVNGTMGYHVWNMRDLTPEQAIAATLGSGTCELVNAAEDLGDGTSSCMCFECGYTALDDWWDEFNYCPNCGRKVVTNG